MSNQKFCLTATIFLILSVLLGFTQASNSTTKTQSNITDHQLSKDNDEIDLSQSLRLKDTLNIFDIQYLASNWRTIRLKLGANCSNDLRTYFEGLKEGALWAAKSK